MARPAVFVSGVGGKTVRSRRVTEQWNRKRATREGGGRARQRAQQEHKERTRRRDGERERRRRKRDSNFFPALDSSSFISHE